MSLHILTARWIVTGTHSAEAAEVPEHAATAFGAGKVLAIGTADDPRKTSPMATYVFSPQPWCFPV